MSVERVFSRVLTAPPPEPGFAGPGHLAVEVLSPREPMVTDPFVLLMDDRIDFAPGRPVGGAHPHAGLETVTLLVEGSVADRDEGVLSEGDLVWMTAGRGIIHNEHVEARGRARVLQLWIALPPNLRDAEPRFQVLRAAEVPVRREPGVEIRVYSGESGGARAPIRNHVPTTLLELRLAPGAHVEQLLPDGHAGFVYGLEGALEVAGRGLAAGDVGFLEAGAGPLRLLAGPEGARAVLYSGRPNRAPVMQYGPFVAGTPADIQALYQRYSRGEFVRLSSLRPVPFEAAPSSAAGA